ncbi:MAG: GxxExxY protein [Planctomycetes bacterium]|nr:GxxExxY protein [Planctomycetota bacterium]
MAGKEDLRAELDRVAAICVDRALYVHQKWGPGLLERAYLLALVYELRKAGLSVATEVPVPLIWDGQDLGVGYRADIVVEGIFVIELKAVAEHSDLFARQLLTYLKLLDLRLGMVINFGMKLLKSGLERVANNF